MTSVDQAIASFERNIQARTGRSVSAWSVLLQEQGFERHGQMTAWLKAEHGLAHGDANHLAKRALEARSPRSEGDPLAHLFEGPKAPLRPLYDLVAASIVRLGPDVAFAPKKANVSVRRRRQFALLQPTTRTRLDLGLILTTEASGRLEPSGSFNAMFTHRVKLSSPEDVDAELEAWLQAAYEQAG